MTLRADVPVSTRKDLSLNYFKLVFLDSFQFMTSSLSALVKNLEGIPITQHLKKEFPLLHDETLNRKGVFPYSYLNSLERLEETCLPPIEEFSNDLSGAKCSESDYEHAQKAWIQFNCQTLGDYMMCYLQLDIYLLADVFEEFRKLTLREDGLDPVHFISLPGLSYMSCFKMTNETIDLLTDRDMYQFFEHGIRGGLTFTNRHRCQSHQAVDENDLNTHLLYIDENNLYGSALCMPLPHSKFKWLSEEELISFNDAAAIQSIGLESEVGYVFEVSLKYPTSIHDVTSDFPLAPHSDEVHPDQFSEYMQRFEDKLCKERKKKYKPTRKLLVTQYDREKYICHYRILQFYLKMGMVLEKVHRGVKFVQHRFLKPYIEYNSRRRSECRNSFEKDFYKLKNNSLFGKTMEDVRKRRDYRISTNHEENSKLAASPYFIDHDIITDNLTGIKMLKPKVLLNKPIYIGQAVLDFAKLEMYHLYYNIIKKCTCIKSVELLGGDTDSFFLAVQTTYDVSVNDIYKELRPYFDSSNYPIDHPLYSAINKARLGCFKDETEGQEIEEMILLKPKMYSIKYKNHSRGIKRAKGLSKVNVRRMTHDDYKDVFRNQTESSIEMTVLRSKQHTVRTQVLRKRGLSAWEDKRCWMDSNRSLPHGHYATGIPLPKRSRLCIPISGDVTCD